MKLLIVDDETKIRSMIRKYAEFEGYEVEEASDGMQAVNLCYLNTYDLVIMDVMMPELDGFTAVREIRKKSQVPILMLSARGEVYDRIHGFENGIDDYVVKPFSPRELMMRIAAIVGRVRGDRSDKNSHRFESGGFVIDFDARTVTVEDSRVELSPKGYELLFYLVSNRGVALTREQIITAVWGYDFYGDDRTLDTHIKLLRKALGEHAKKIVTLRGVGYRFDA